MVRSAGIVIHALVVDIMTIPTMILTITTANRTTFSRGIAAPAAAVLAAGTAHAQTSGTVTAVGATVAVGTAGACGSTVAGSRPLHLHLPGAPGWNLTKPRASH